MTTNTALSTNLPIPYTGDLPPLPPATPRRAARLMLAAITGFFALALAWAALARLPETAFAAGRVVPARQLQVLSHPSGGTVRTLLVRPGQKVRKGQALMSLDPAMAVAELGRNTATTGALDARIARLAAEAAGTSPQFGPGLHPAAVASERGLWLARQTELSAAGSGEGARLDAALRSLAEAEAARDAQASVRAQAAREVEALAPLVARGIEPGMNLDRARAALTQANAAFAGAGQAVARAAASAAEARAGRAGIVGRFRAQAAEALAAARAERAASGASQNALAGRVDDSIVRSPVDGTVLRVLANTIGASVAPGQPLAEVVPAGDRLVVEARLRPSDIGFVHPGQKARVKLTAYDSARFGSLAGTVAGIAPDAVTDPRTGETWYDVRIATAETLRDPDGREVRIAPGMVAEVALLGAERSVLAYLGGPLVRIGDRALRER